MKICLINNIYPPYDRGGAEQVVVKTVEGLLSAGHEVVIITSCPGKGSVTKENHLTIYRIHPLNIFFYTDAHQHTWLARALWHLFDIFNFSVTRQIRHILTIEQPEIVHTHNLMGLSFLLPRLIRRLGLRHVHTVHDVQLVEPSGMILKNKETSWRYTGWPTRAYTALMRRLMGSPHVVISPSQFLLDFYQARGFFAHSLCEVVRNPITFNYLLLPKTTERPNGEFHFLYVGQIETHKGVAFLVTSFKRLLVVTTENIFLHIVGNGSLLPVIQKEVAACPQIKIYGRVERSALPDLFATMNVTIVPSLCYENSPTVIFESLACGVPVLASNIEGIAELIKEGENGRTFVAGDVDSLVENMRWALGHRDVIEAMSGKTTWSLRGLSLEEYVAKLSGLYR